MKKPSGVSKELEVYFLGGVQGWSSSVIRFCSFAVADESGRAVTKSHLFLSLFQMRYCTMFICNRRLSFRSST